MCWQGFGALGYPRGNVVDASANYNETGDDYLDYWYSTEFLPTPLAGTPWFEQEGSEPSIPRVQGSPVMDRSYFGSQYSTTEKIHNLSISDGERVGIPDSEAASGFHRPSFETHPRFDSAQATTIVSDQSAVVGRANSLLSPLAGMAEKRGTTQVPAESPSVDVNNFEIQLSRAKRTVSPDRSHERKRTRRKKQQHFAAREQKQVSPAGIRLTYKGIVTEVVLNGPDYYALAHAPRSLCGGADRVPITKRTELAATAPDRFQHGPGGREKARRDQSRRCLESTL
jgi:hypothetical protein